MNDIVISPWLIYFIESVNHLLVLFGISMFAFAGLSIFLYIYSLVGVNPSVSSKDKKKVRKYAVICAIFSIISAILFFITPSKDTCYKMLAVNYATSDNVDNYNDIVDYVIGKEGN